MFISARAFAVHIFTAAGAALALAALLYAARGQWAAMFLCLGIALIVDGIDGTIARWLKVAEVLPRWSGDVLDFVVDFATYVFVPAYAIAAGGLLPELLALPAGVVIVVSGALYFADRQMKTADNYFRGFPALWNVAAFYLFLLKPAPALAAIIVAGLAVLSFVPFKFLHPLRVTRLRMLNIIGLILWSVLALIAVLEGLAPGPWVAGGLVVIALYFLGVGLAERR
ncbi:MAG TPA: CDP-alcohol phosphatidyltransferase family protein [Xanthobacteraceae bacterium]|jgi:phosphatidylcholine synthase|nr:CDP-alcohol phosphatidyltransferase family protein [Xanthobacteraceae bacterium]